MKACALISGLPREFRQSFEYLDKYIFQPYQPTIIISTWNVVNPPVFEIEGTTRYPGEGSLDEYYSLYKPDLFDVEYWDEKQEKRFNIEKYYARKHPHANVIRCQAMHYKIFRSYQLSLDFGEFDVYIKVRSDLKIGEIPREKLEKPNTLFSDAIKNGLNIPIVSDILFWGSRDIMNHVCNMYNNTDSLFDAGVPYDPESLLTEHVFRSNIPVEKGIDVEILRPKEWYERH